MSVSGRCVERAALLVQQQTAQEIVSPTFSRFLHWKYASGNFSQVEDSHMCVTWFTVKASLCWGEGEGLPSLTQNWSVQFSEPDR